MYLTTIAIKYLLLWLLNRHNMDQSSMLKSLKLLLLALLEVHQQLSQGSGSCHRCATVPSAWGPHGVYPMESVTAREKCP